MPHLGAFLVDLTGFFWNQVNKQLNSWYRMFSTSVSGYQVFIEPRSLVFRHEKAVVLKMLLMRREEL